MKPFDITVEFGLGPDAEFPFAATVNGARWVLRVNDFPAEMMWTLLVDDAEIVNFDGDAWPKTWTQPRHGPEGIAPTTAAAPTIAAVPTTAPIASAVRPADPTAERPAAQRPAAPLPAAPRPAAPRPVAAPLTVEERIAALAARAVWRLELTPERMRAHRAWAEGGRPGPCPVVIEGKNLSDAPCSGVFLVAAQLTRCDLSRVNASLANLSEVELIDCVGDAMSLAQSRARGLRVRGGRYHHVDLRLTDLEGAHIERTDWTRARLDRARFTDARLEQVDLTQAAVWDAVFDRATLTRCDLRGADLSKRNQVLRLCTTRATRFIDCDLRGVHFEGRHLEGTVFERCRFHGAAGKAVFDGPITVISADFSAAGDGSDVRGADDVRALLGG